MQLGSYVTDNIHACMAWNHKYNKKIISLPDITGYINCTYAAMVNWL